jgi:predicted membrane protein
LALIAWGLLALLDNLGFVEMRGLLRTFWPTLVVAWGASRLLGGRRGERWIGLLAVVAGGILLGNRLLGWHVNVFGLWPIILIVVGIRVIVRGRWGRWEARHHPQVRVEVSSSGTESTHTPPASTGGRTDDRTADRTSSSSTLREFALLGGVERRNTSQTFQSGEVTAVLGGVQIDLRDCRLTDPEAHVEVFACMGGISLRIPSDWAVESRVSAILGGFDDRSTPPVDGSAKRLVISGQAVMGGIEIKN